ncbi:hypothetical protein QJS66_14095 [Kocuria rhizophila]|nr:hypothetical protein QJS66_14095 [Kocuria rhizophila]
MVRGPSGTNPDPAGGRRHRGFMERGVSVAAHQQAGARGYVGERMDAWRRAAGGRGRASPVVQANPFAVEGERRLAAEMLPDRAYVRPLLVVVPREGG